MFYAPSTDFDNVGLFSKSHVCPAASMARTVPRLLDKAYGCIRWLERSRKYQILFSVFLLVIVILQMLYGILTIPEFKRPAILNNVKFEIPWHYLPNASQFNPNRFFSGETKKKESAAKDKAKECKKWKITMCAMVYNEVPYLMEWIEFHRLQGVDHFVVYNYYGTDLVEYAPMYYEYIGQNGVIHVEPARFYGLDAKRPKNATDYAQSKIWSQTDCYNRYGKDTGWFLMAQVGHFVYSNEYENITAFLDDQLDAQKETTTTEGSVSYTDEPFSAVRIPTVRWGTGGQVDKFRTWLTPNAYTGWADLLYEPYDNTGNMFPMVLETNTYRAPHRELDANYTDLPLCSELEGSDAFGLCSDATTVTLVKSGRCPRSEDISKCLDPEDHYIWPELPVLRADYHEWRSLDHARKFVYMEPVQNRTFEALDMSWFSLIKDENKKEWFADKVRERIMKLKPRLFYDVGRECRADALMAGQQMMCPETHPYPFGNSGIKFLRDCCHKDKDVYGNPLEINSGSCDNHTFIECNEPPGMLKWHHRSCCIWNSAYAHYKPVM